MGEVFVTKKSNTNSTKASETKITRIKASDSDNNKKNNFKELYRGKQKQYDNEEYAFLELKLQ